MLIFVQVYRTIEIFLYLYKVLEEQKRAKESTKRKVEASEEKCSWSTKCSWSDDVIRSKFIRSASSEARSPEAKVHQEMKNLKDSRAGNMIWSRLSIVRDWKSITTTLGKEFKSIGCLFYQERWQRTIVRTVQPLPPLLCSCLCKKTRITALPTKMFLHTRNAFEIDPSQDNNHIKQKIIGDYQQTSNDSFCVLAFLQRIFHTTI